MPFQCRTKGGRCCSVWAVVKTQGMICTPDAAPQTSRRLQCILTVPERATVPIGHQRHHCCYECSCSHTPTPMAQRSMQPFAATAVVAKIDVPMDITATAGADNTDLPITTASKQACCAASSSQPASFLVSSSKLAVPACKSCSCYNSGIWQSRGCATGVRRDS